MNGVSLSRDVKLKAECKCWGRMSRAGSGARGGSSTQWPQGLHRAVIRGKGRGRIVKENDIQYAVASTDGKKQ